jgi:two-component system sensor histidine kinase QseC
MRYSLSTKLIVSTATTLVIIAIFVFVAITAIFRWQPQILLEQEMLGHADKIRSGLRFDASGKISKVVLPADMQVIYDAVKSDAIYRILDDTGAVMLASDCGTIALTAPNTQFDPGTSIDNNIVLQRSGLTLHVLTKVVSHDGKIFYAQIARSDRLQRAILGNDSASFMTATGIALIIAILVFTSVVWLTFHHALRPLRTASDAASRIESNSLDSRLSAANMPKELVPLIDAFNKALDRLERGFRLQQEFLATVAHELKTPLALIRGQIELDGLADRQLLLKDVDRMARQVHQLLHLTEVSDRENFVFEQLDVDEVVQNVVEHLGRLANRSVVYIVHNSPPRKILVTADSGALFVLVKNLLENAIHHSPIGTGVVITVAVDRISIRDYGKGISPDNLPMLFNRFWRGPNRRDEGAGLGLSICKEISAAHDWDLIVNSDKRPGAEFIVEFSGLP